MLGRDLLIGDMLDRSLPRRLNTGRRLHTFSNGCEP